MGGFVLIPCAVPDGVNAGLNGLPGGAFGGACGECGRSSQRAKCVCGLGRRSGKEVGTPDAGEQAELSLFSVWIGGGGGARGICGGEGTWVMGGVPKREKHSTIFVYTFFV